MSGGHHRNDEANGPSPPGERETEGQYKSREQINYAQLVRDTSVLGKQKIRQNLLDGAHPSERLRVQTDALSQRLVSQIVGQFHLRP